MRFVIFDNFNDAPLKITKDKRAICLSIQDDSNPNEQLHYIYQLPLDILNRDDKVDIIKDIIFKWTEKYNIDQDGYHKNDIQCNDRAWDALRYYECDLQ
jgi:hypothetical protein